MENQVGNLNGNGRLKKWLFPSSKRKCLQINENKLSIIVFKYTTIIECCLNNCCAVCCRDVKLEYKRLKEKMKEYNKRDAQFYGKMFSKLG